MKALILAGGKGTRLRPITHTNAKQLVPIANKPILFYGIEAMLEAGINDIGVIVGDTAEEVKNAIEEKKFKAKFTFIMQEAPLGLAHAVKIAKSFIKNDDFVMFLGDNLVKDGVVSFVENFKKNKPNAQILLAEVKNPSEFGVAEIKGNKVINLIEKPKIPKSNLALVGIYLFDKNIFTAVESIKPSARNELEITDAIQFLIANKLKVEYKIISGWWKDTGKLEDMLEANRLIMDSIIFENKGFIDKNSCIEGKVIIEKGAKIINSKIRGPVIIGENSIIKNSFIGPFSSIYYDVKIENCEIEHSIILEKSTIIDIRRIEDSLIGQNVKITKTHKIPKAYRIMVGDSSMVEII